MDYAGLTAGVTVMLPVYEPGALLFIGDGHARQGEGEMVGTGLETSMDVEFTVDRQEEAIGWPRLETKTHIMVLGSARPLLEALQHATSEMHAGSGRLRLSRTRRLRCSWARRWNTTSPTWSIRASPSSRSCRSRCWRAEVVIHPRAIRAGTRFRTRASTTLSTP